MRPEHYYMRITRIRGFAAGPEYQPPDRVNVFSPYRPGLFVVIGTRRFTYCAGVYPHLRHCVCVCVRYLRRYGEILIVVVGLQPLENEFLVEVVRHLSTSWGWFRLRYWDILAFFTVKYGQYMKGSFSFPKVGLIMKKFP